MSKSQLKRKVDELEIKRGLGNRQYVQSVVFDSGMMDSSQQFCEFRSLKVDDGSEKGLCIRRLKPGEMISDAVGGLEEWIKNPHYDPDPESRRRRMEEARRRSV